MNKIYGVRNGVVSECRAKDPAHCPYHTSHGSFEDMEKVADAKNEALQERLEDLQSTRLFASDMPDSLRQDIEDKMSNIISKMEDGKRYSFDDLKTQFIKDGNTFYKSLEDVDYDTISETLFQNGSYPKDWPEEHKYLWLHSLMVKTKADELKDRILHSDYAPLPTEQEEIDKNLDEFCLNKANSDLRDDQLSYLDKNYDNIRYFALDQYETHYPKKEKLLKDTFIMDYVNSDKGIFCGLKDKDFITKEDMEDQLNLIQQTK